MKRLIPLLALLGLLAASAGCTVSATTGNAPDEAVAANKAMFQRFVDEVLNQGDVEVIDELLTENFVEHEEAPGMPEGREGVKAFVQMLRTGFPDLEATVVHMIGEGDMVVAHMTWSGTHEGEFMGMPATGKEVSFGVMDLVRFEGGKAVEHWGITDMMTMMMQVGAMEMPAM